MAKRLITTSRKNSSYRTADEQKRKNPGAVRIAKKRTAQRGISVDVLPALLNLEQHLQDEGTLVEKKKAVVSDNKNGTDTYLRNDVVIDIPPTVLSAFKGMFNSNKTYRFRLTRVASIVTSGGGTMGLATGVYPGQFDQYTALSILFSQSRLIRTKIEYMLLAPIAQTSSTTYAAIPGVFVSAFDQSQYGGTSYLYSQLQRRAGAVQFTSTFTGKKVSNTYTTKRDSRLWSNIAVQSGTDPYGGNVGAWCISLANVGSTTLAYWEYLITADYEFTGLY